MCVFLSTERKGRREEKATVCVLEKREKVRGDGGYGGLRTKGVKYRIYEVRGQQNGIRGKRKGERGDLGQKAERKQVDNDRFQSNQHNQQNIPQDPPTILPSTQVPTFR